MKFPHPFEIAYQRFQFARIHTVLYKHLCIDRCMNVLLLYVVLEPRFFHAEAFVFFEFRKGFGDGLRVRTLRSQGGSKILRAVLRGHEEASKRLAVFRFTGLLILVFVLVVDWVVNSNIEFTHRRRAGIERFERRACHCRVAHVLGWLWNAARSEDNVALLEH